MVISVSAAGVWIVVGDVIGGHLYLFLGCFHCLSAVKNLHFFPGLLAKTRPGCTVNK